MLLYNENYLSIFDLLEKANNLTYKIGLLEEKCNTFSFTIHFNNLTEDREKFYKMDDIALLFSEAACVADGFYINIPNGKKEKLLNYVKDLERIEKEINTLMNEFKEKGLNN